MEMLLVYLILLGNILNRMEFDRMVIVYEAMVRRIFVEFRSLSKDRRLNILNFFIILVFLPLVHSESA